MASNNLDNYKTGNNSDWALWVRLVKEAHKEQGIKLSQPQALILAKESYPGKNNVVSRFEEGHNFNIKTKQESELPPNPVRRKKTNPPPPRDPRGDRSKRRTKEYEDEPVGRRKSSTSRRDPYESDEYSSPEYSPPPKRSRSRRDYDRSPSPRRSRGDRSPRRDYDRPRRSRSPSRSDRSRRSR